MAKFMTILIIHNYNNTPIAKAIKPSTLHPHPSILRPGLFVTFGEVEAEVRDTVMLVPGLEEVIDADVVGLVALKPIAAAGPSEHSLLPICKSLLHIPGFHAMINDSGIPFSVAIV